MNTQKPQPQTDEEKKKQRTEIIIAIIFAVVIMIGGYLVSNYGYFDAEAKSLEVQQQKLTELQASNTTLEEISKHMPELENESNQVDADYQRLLPLVPNKNDLSTVLQDVQSAAIRRGLRLESFTPSTAKIKPGTLNEIPVQAEILGDDSSLRGYLTELAHFSRILQVNSVEYTRIQEGELKGNVKAKVNLSAFTSSENKAKDKK